MKKFACVMSVAILASLVHPSWAQVGKRFASERRVVKDSVTGTPMVVLTSGKYGNEKIYQTHPQWTADGKYIIFHSRGRTAPRQIMAIHEESGDVIQLTDEPEIIFGSLNISRKSMTLYYTRNVHVNESGQPTEDTTTPLIKQVIALDLARLLADSEAGTSKPGPSY